MSEPTTDQANEGPECDMCGKTTCADARLPEFSEPVGCIYTPLYDRIRYDRCEYGCGRDITKVTIRRDIAPEFDRIVAERLVEAWDEGMRTGTSRAMRKMSDEPGLPLAGPEDNPYLIRTRPGAST